MFTRSFRAILTAVSAAALVMVGFTSCDKDDEIFDAQLKSKPASVVETGYFSKNTDRDLENGTITIGKNINGVDVHEDTTIVVPLGNITFSINPNDTTVVGENSVAHQNFVLGNAKTESYEVDYTTYRVAFTKSVREFNDTFDKYGKQGSISYLDAVVYYKGQRFELPKANGSVSYQTVSTSDAGLEKGGYNYTLATSEYETSFKGEKLRNEQGFHTLATNAEDKLISTQKTNEGFEVISFDTNGNPATEKSWIELTRNYSISGAVKSVYEVILNSAVEAPAYDIVVLKSFNLEKIAQNLGSEATAGTRTDGNFQIVKKQVKQVVGNDQFTKTFTYSYEKATLTIDGKTYDMPFEAYRNITDLGFTMSEMAMSDNYDRMLNVHSVLSSFAGYDVKAKAETEIRVAVEKDEMTSRTITGEGFDYLNENTSNSWIEITEIWSKSGKKTYKKSVNLANSITAPAKIQKIVSSFDLRQATAQLGSEKLVNTRTVGDFTVKTYQRTYVVGNNEFTREFVLSYEKAVYNPMNHNMIWKGYENTQDGGFTTGNLSDAQKDGKTYTRKSYTHKMSASFNDRNYNSKAEAELLVEKVQEEERETPHWLGAPVSAKYTRVQRVTGEKFMDMIVFTYQNGVVMAPNGQVDMNLIYAFDSNVASKNGVETCLKNASYSGVWTGSKWAPAGITITNGRWIYAGKNASWDHTVMENNAITLGIGVDVTPTPKAQSYKVEGNKITIKYARNNGKTTTDTSLELR